MCTVVFLKESNTLYQSLTKPDKTKVLNEPKQTELAEQKHCVNTMHTNSCVTFDMLFVSCGPANDCHQMTFLTTRSAARILIRNLRHRQALLLTRPAVLLGKGRPDTREWRKSSLRFPGLFEKQAPGLRGLYTRGLIARIK